MAADPLRTAADVLAEATDVTLVAHVQPDADSLGSALALGIALRRRGATVRVAFATPAEMPETLRALDVSGLVAFDAARVSIMIDHHVSNPGFGDVQLLDPEAEATVVVAYRVLMAMGAPLDVDVARCLYAGLVTDTVGFRTAGEAAHRLTHPSSEIERVYVATVQGNAKRAAEQARRGVELVQRFARDRLPDVEHAGDVGLQQLFPPLGREVFERRSKLHAGIVDENVDRA